MKYNWQLMADKYPAIGTKFVALYNDGGGACLFIRQEGDLIVDSGFEISSEEVLDDFLLWCEVPDNYKFWGEPE
jgi:hypothetical protein